MSCKTRVRRTKSVWKATAELRKALPIDGDVVENILYAEQQRAGYTRRKQRRLSC